MEKNINTFYLLHLRLPAISRYRGCHEKGLLGTEVAVHQRNGSRDRDRGVYRTTQAPGWNPTDYLAVCVKAKHMPIFHGDFFLLVHMCAGRLKAAYPCADVILWETRSALSRWLKFNMTLSFDHADMVPKGIKAWHKIIWPLWISRQKRLLWCPTHRSLYSGTVVSFYQKDTFINI